MSKPYTDLKIDRAVAALVYIEAYKTENGGNTPNNEEIAEALGIATEGQARLIVDILEESGLITVVKGEGGRRRWIIVKGSRYVPTDIVEIVSASAMLEKTDGMFTDEIADEVVADQVRKAVLSGLE